MSRPARLYLPGELFQDSQVRLTPPASHYLTRVLRLKPGERWVALDGQSRSWLCELVTPEQGRRLEDWPAVPPLARRLEVGLALCKGSRFEDALEKLAELGVERVVPLLTERTERGAPSPSRWERWQEIARSGSALAQRLVPLEISPCQELSSYLQKPSPALTLFGHRQGRTAPEIPWHEAVGFRLLIGPEGGFSPAEIARLSPTATPMSLGPFNLRVETAAVCAASLILQNALAPPP